MILIIGAQKVSPNVDVRTIEVTMRDIWDWKVYEKRTQRIEKDKDRGR